MTKTEYLQIAIRVIQDCDGQRAEPHPAIKYINKVIELIKIDEAKNET